MDGAMVTTACSRSRQLAFRHLSLVTLGLLVMVAPMWLGLAIATQATRSAGSSSVYSLASLQSGLHRDPHAWLQRTVRVQAVAVQCQGWGVEPVSCFDWQPSLVDARDASAPALPLVAAPTSPSLTWLRGLPLIGRYMPQLHAIQWGVSADYMLRIRAIACAGSTPSLCYQVVVLDVAL